MDLDAVRRGFLCAAAYNSGIIVISRGFGDHLGVVDPLFDSNGSVAVVLWGVAYAAFCDPRRILPIPEWCDLIQRVAALVFAIEKAYYGFHWLFWLLSAERPALGEILRKDVMAGIFFATYGAGDLASMVFFLLVAMRWRLHGAKEKSNSD
eukprot:TRINITY_DN103057_c0_g1_i1.p1 TRINITY_DN103057_c0_g1~~TRINITY_DN103057_c0_g1_i1.p1  ORF type:complete len:177 (-),score=14.78 TRINITY_DN103057_c0_g1_i1:255-707(-)